MLRNLIVERSDGNPFYLEELLRSLIDQGDLVQEGDRWHLSRQLQDLDIPETLQGVLLARLDRLGEDVRQTLQLAAVIGRSFLFRLLEAISEAERQLNSHLDELQRVDLVARNLACRSWNISSNIRLPRRLPIILSYSSGVANSTVGLLLGWSAFFPDERLNTLACLLITMTLPEIPKKLSNICCLLAIKPAS